ncbi:MAG: glycosyltransferase family 4 protein [Solirubrobacterales bacterium]|nr:glycosyltransferase family 4 protein [Solirubrobacterales bacterium]MBV9472104.1 glycosyltransferase family 4 protein [Solirubrobacterales bacterium]
MSQELDPPGPELGSNGLRWGILAAAGKVRAESYAREQGIEPALTLERADLLTGPSALRERARHTRLDAAMVHSADWRRERSPQLYELALALIPARRRVIADEATGRIAPVGRGELAAGVARLPLALAQAGGAITAEALRLTLGHPRAFAEPAGRAPNGARSVLAIWPGSSGTVGGAVSHITGILGGLRRAGLRIGMLTGAPPPDQVRAVLDDVEVTPPLAAAARMTGDTAEILANPALRTAGLELARRLRPSFIYQRHASFMVAGAELSRRCSIPLVLEWNGSEVWARSNWSRKLAVERLLDPLAAVAERTALRHASIVASVSREAGEMAIQAGASPSKVLVVPNAVDLPYVERSVNGLARNSFPPRAARSPRTADALIGWAGSFGPWHGGEVIVRALARLPVRVHLLMIGDGPERARCQAVALELAVSDRIEWTGPIPHPGALRRLAQCDVLVSPQTPLPGQRYFQSPIKLFEYMALGRPIVASRLGQMEELLTDRVNARLVEPGEVAELAAVIAELLHSEDRGRALGEAARHEAEANHTWDQRAQMILGALEIDANRT